MKTPFASSFLVTSHLFLSVAFGLDGEDLNAPSIGVSAVEVASVYDNLKKNDLKLPTRVGVLVVRVEPNSPADLAKIKQFDIILRIQRTTLRTVQDFIDAVSTLEIGKEYAFTGFRVSEHGGKKRWKKGTTKLTPLARREVLLNTMTRSEDDVRGIVFWRHSESPEFAQVRRRAVPQRS